MITAALCLCFEAGLNSPDFRTREAHSRLLPNLPAVALRLRKSAVPEVVRRALAVPQPAPTAGKRTLWVRCGQGDSYHRFTSLGAAAKYCAGKKVHPFLMPTWPNDLGVSDGGRYAGENYVSLFWGTPDVYDLVSAGVRGLSAAELAEVNRELARLEHEGK